MQEQVPEGRRQHAGHGGAYHVRYFLRREAGVRPSGERTVELHHHNLVRLDLVGDGGELRAPVHAGGLCFYLLAVLDELL
eukprot:1188322-Prorocentrum_minimum.AAC.2